MRLIDAVEKSATEGPGRYRLESLLYQTLGTLPDREDLRLKLAQLLFDLQRYADAETQAQMLLKSANSDTEVAASDTEVAARRIVALAQSAQARPGGMVTIAEAAKALKESLAR